MSNHSLSWVPSLQSYDRDVQKAWYINVWCSEGAVHSTGTDRRTSASAPAQLRTLKPSARDGGGAIVALPQRSLTLALSGESGPYLLP